MLAARSRTMRWGARRKHGVLAEEKAGHAVLFEKDLGKLFASLARVESRLGVHERILEESLVRRANSRVDLVPC